MNLNMVPEMTYRSIKDNLAGVSEDSPRFVLVCDRADWSIFKAETNRTNGIELPISFWQHDENTDGGGLFHYDSDDTYLIWTTSIRAIFNSEEKALEVARKLTAASRKYEDAVKAPFVAYQMELMMAIA